MPTHLPGYGDRYYWQSVEVLIYNRDEPRVKPLPGHTRRCSFWNLVIACSHGHVDLTDAERPYWFYSVSDVN